MKQRMVFLLLVSVVVHYTLTHRAIIKFKWLNEYRKQVVVNGKPMNTEPEKGGQLQKTKTGLINIERFRRPEKFYYKRYLTEKHENVMDSSSANRSLIGNFNAVT